MAGNPTKTRTPQQEAARARAWKWNLQKNYGLTIEDYDELYAAQNGQCAICSKHQSRLCVDHDHDTGQVRALLCQHCNSGIGFFDDDLTLLLSAAAYLATHDQEGLGN